MSYRCDVCREIVPPGKPMIRHTIYKEVDGNKQIASEPPVCSSCKERLLGGIDFNELKRYLTPVKVETEPVKTEPTVDYGAMLDAPSLKIGVGIKSKPIALKEQEEIVLVTECQQTLEQVLAEPDAEPVRFGKSVKRGQTIPKSQPALTTTTPTEVGVAADDPGFKPGRKGKRGFKPEAE